MVWYWIKHKVKFNLLSKHDWWKKYVTRPINNTPKNTFRLTRILYIKKLYNVCGRVLRAERCQTCTESAGNGLSNFEEQRSSKKDEYQNYRLTRVMYFKYSTTAMQARNSWGTICFLDYASHNHAISTRYNKRNIVIKTARKPVRQKWICLAVERFTK
jgi:hypothetical protein